MPESNVLFPCFWMVGVSEEFFLSNLPMVSIFQFDTYRHDMSVFFKTIYFAFLSCVTHPYSWLSIL